MSFALPARQVTFGRSTHVPPQQQYQQQQQAFAQPQQANNGLALPYSSNAAFLPGPTGLALPGSGPTAANSSFPQPQTSLTNKSQSPSQTPPATAGPSQAAGPVAGPSTPPQTAVPSTPAPLTLEQQHITAVEGIVPTLQNIVATVNLDCRLDLKTIALHARNAEYNPKVCTRFI